MRPATATALCIALTVPVAGARPAFYWSTAEGTFVTADYLSFADSDFETADGDAGGSRSNISGQYEFAGNHAWVLGVGHEYNALDFNDEPEALPQTNGDLHTLHLATQWATDIGPGALRLSFAPALSVSSNGLKNPDELDSEALQIWGAALYTRAGGTVNWVLGAAHDYRFGESRVYPAVGLEWRGDDMFLRAVFPDLLFTVNFSRGWTAAFSTSPDGNEWLAYDRGMDNQDEFRREAWQSDLRLAYRFANGVSLGASVGYHWNQEWEFRRHDGRVAQVESDDSPFLGVHLGWR